MSAGQKRAKDLITDGCEPPCGCRDLTSGPLEEQAMLLTSEPFLQPLPFFLIFIYLFTLYTIYSVCVYVCRPEEGTRSHYRWL